MQDCDLLKLIVLIGCFQMDEQLDRIYLYRFESNDNERIKQLLDSKFYISDPNKFNDPLDFKLEVKDKTFSSYDDEKFKKLVKFIFEEQVVDDFWIFDEQVKEVISNWYNNADLSVDLEKVISSFKQRVMTFGVRCFMRGYKNPLSWSHYAKGHQGFCIEYEFNPMVLATRNNSKWAFYHVNYSNRLPELCISELLLTPRQAMEKLFATKSIEWAYEQEVRIVNFESKSCLVDIPSGLKMNRLIAGVNMPKEQIETLKSIGLRLDIPVYQMQRNNSDFESLWGSNRIT